MLPSFGRPQIERFCALRLVLSNRFAEQILSELRKPLEQVSQRSNIWEQREANWLLGRSESLAGSDKRDRDTMDTRQTIFPLAID